MSSRNLERFLSLRAFSMPFAIFAASLHFPGKAAAYSNASSPPQFQIWWQGNGLNCWRTAPSAPASCGTCIAAPGPDGTTSRVTCLPDASRLGANPTLVPRRGTVTVSATVPQFWQDWTGAIVTIPVETRRRVTATIYEAVEADSGYDYFSYIAPASSYTPAVYNASKREFCAPESSNTTYYQLRADAEYTYPQSRLICYLARDNASIVPAKFTRRHPGL